MKTNSAKRFPGMLATEAEGLRKVASTNTIAMPGVIGSACLADEQFLILAWIETGVNDVESQEKFGNALALLHQNSTSDFGLDHNNYMGSLLQSNVKKNSWSDFFITQRLLPQVELGKQHGLLNKDILKQFDSLYTKIDSLYPKEQPALVHGDLWSGNYIIDRAKQPVVVDPAVSYANREVDIAMTTLFGGFERSFYDGYNEVFPLQQGWNERLELWNLYPLLIHLNLFGQSYLPLLTKSLQRFC